MKMIRRVMARVVQPSPVELKRPAEPVFPDVPFACPACGETRIRWDLTCHTYEQSAGKWVACMPCDSAVEYYCGAEDCAWLYTHGLNSGNPRSAANEARRPPWLPPEVQFSPHGFAVTHPAARSAWDDDDGE